MTLADGRTWNTVHQMAAESSRIERIAFFKSTTDEVELLMAGDSARVWTVFNNDYSIAVPDDWHGRVEYRGHRLDVSRTQILCTEPGELHCARPWEEMPGTFNVLNLRPSAWEAVCETEGIRGKPRWSTIVTEPSADLRRAFQRLRAAVEERAERLEVQSRLALLAHFSRCELITSPRRPPTPAPSAKVLEQVRERLHERQGASLNLMQVAQEVGLSQFQLLRGFKRRYGAPPHSYEIYVRVQRAKQLLRRGSSIADAAAATDFVDQSHLTRHFRRIWGITPGAYIRHF
jgi:AraC-like DNA-binding protein